MNLKFSTLLLSLLFFLLIGGRKKIIAQEILTSKLSNTTFNYNESLIDLKITEIHYNPLADGNTDGDEFEFLELKNIGLVDLNISSAKFITGLQYVFNSGTIMAPGEFIVLVSNSSMFKQRYGIDPFGQYVGKLNNGGERIVFVSASGDTVLNVKYGDKAPWPTAPDGNGFSLVSKNHNPNTSPNNYEYWRSSYGINGSPMADDIGEDIPLVFVNEVLSHTDYPQVDAVEIFNPNLEPADISGWYLTDDVTQPEKWKIPANSLIPANGYITFYEGYYQGTELIMTSDYFGSEFSISSHGEALFIYSADSDGDLNGYIHGFSFGESANGVSFGRYLTSENEVHFVSQKSISLNEKNSGPLVKPLVISEINYDPDINNYEYLKITNISNTNINLFHPTETENTWKINGISFEFPQNSEIDGSESIYIVDTTVSSAQFIEINKLPGSTQVFNFNGSLSNSGENLQILQPVDSFVLDDSTIVPYLIIDEVKYNDKLPWPDDALGTGNSIVRIDIKEYGNDPINWESKKLITNLSDIVDDNLPSTFELLQNYPNPFNPTTNISYQLPKISFVELIIYDMLGRKVTTLINEIKSAGHHQVQFNASALSSGMYIYRLRAGDFIATKKLVLIK